MSSYEEMQKVADKAIDEFMETYSEMSPEQKAIVAFVLNWIRSNLKGGYKRLLSVRKNGLLARIRE